MAKEKVFEYSKMKYSSLVFYINSKSETFDRREFTLNNKWLLTLPLQRIICCPPHL